MNLATLVAHCFDPTEIGPNTAKVQSELFTVREFQNEVLDALGEIFLFREEHSTAQVYFDEAGTVLDEEKVNNQVDGLLRRGKLSLAETWHSTYIPDREIDFPAWGERLALYGHPYVMEQAFGRIEEEFPTHLMLIARAMATYREGDLQEAIHQLNPQLLKTAGDLGEETIEMLRPGVEYLNRVAERDAVIAVSLKPGISLEQANRYMALGRMAVLEGDHKEANRMAEQLGENGYFKEARTIYTMTEGQPPWPVWHLEQQALIVDGNFKDLNRYQRDRGEELGEEDAAECMRNAVELGKFSDAVDAAEYARATLDEADYLAIISANVAQPGHDCKMDPLTSAMKAADRLSSTSQWMRVLTVAANSNPELHAAGIVRGVHAIAELDSNTSLTAYFTEKRDLLRGYLPA